MLRATPEHQGTRRCCAEHGVVRSEEHTSELQSLTNLVCRLLLEKKKNRVKLQKKSNKLISHDFKNNRDNKRICAISNELKQLCTFNKSIELINMCKSTNLRYRQ